MWTRQSLKTDAKATLKTCFGSSILVCLIESFISGIGSASSSSSNSSSTSFFTTEQLMAYAMLMLGASVISLVIQIFVGNLLTVGSAHFFLSARIKPSGVELITFPFKKGRYGNVFKATFMMNLFIFLWSLLFVIPGIYKSYQYRMVPYLLAENPEMDYKRALELSKAMMDGEKMNAFVLDLSFLGWILLSIPTCMILGIVYVFPYISHTNAGLYIALREKAVNTGLVNPAELYAVVNPVPGQM